MPKIEVLDESPDPCVAAVGGSKVALLFLSRGELHHQAAWRLWFRSAAGILPTAVATPDKEDGLCSFDQEDLQEARAACSLEGNTAISSDDVIAHQHLFSVYIHLSAEVDEAALSPMWRSRLVEHRVPTEWGTHSLVEATRSMLWEAFKDPSNERFVLVSEADIPIWDPLTFYYELISEQRSRVDAWWHPDMDVNRWSWRMAWSGARIRRSDWRKSAQWFSIIRSHAEVTLRDETIFVAFEDHCSSAFDGDIGKWRDCYSDEHYLPTLLHMKGLQEETVPSPLGVTAADWTEHKPHPHEYTSEEVTPELFTTRLRNNSDCPSIKEQHRAVQEAARHQFAAIEHILGPQRDGFCSRKIKQQPQKKNTETVLELESSEESIGPNSRNSILPSGCSLLARKFPAESSSAVLAVFQNCTSGLMLIGDAECQHQV